MIYFNQLIEDLHYLVCVHSYVRFLFYLMRLIMTRI